MRGRSFLLETIDENNDYKPLVAFTDKDAVSFMICETIPLHSNRICIELKSNKSAILNVKNSLRWANTPLQNKEIINKYLQVLESESSIEF
jgi:hypothetical protein